ncbi:potassium-transporting ATPase C chain [Aquipluma nitroreducens]|uniref:Potassium-transporting ATPase KdpC subunit n=1 Tax=Aquipluma nitroreducens TaxID=2010828 RepID=A0A5K7SBW6_9BACT|nr:potassium-transporting ATPase subunit KdpC [Aquipluma nitroreducens]BBE19063.1 potassium-transporting ATPase C chain [Aquipluma nitroreducens]
MNTQIKIALKIFILFTVLLGGIYPLVITGVAQLVFPEKANGSLIVVDNKTIGSKLIGQNFDSDIYFSSRPSAIDYNPLPSGGSNLGLTSEKLKQQVADRKLEFVKANQLTANMPIPSEMLFASASGLDPHILPEAAIIQVGRIENARKLNSTQKQQLFQAINQLTEEPQFLFLGEARINVLKLNLELDKIDVNHIRKN